MESKNKCCCSARTKERSPEEFKILSNRLSRIEGQIRGIKKMLENNASCPDILHSHFSGECGVKLVQQSSFGRTHKFLRSERY